MIGIYKITSPSGKIYIGQSRNIEKRIKYYQKLHCKTQYKLYNSLKKYGYEKHIFEILELCKEEDLNLLERKWQDFYNVLSNEGLNLTLTNTNDKIGIRSEETRRKISESLKNCGRIYHKKVKIEKEKGIDTRFKKGISNKFASKKVININTNEIFNSAKEVSEIFNIKYGYLLQQLRGFVKNNTKFKYYEQKEEVISS